MAVTTLYMSDRDLEKRTFTDKKEADALDKKLELAENLRLFFEAKIEGMSEEMAEETGLLIALKGKPEVLVETNLDKGNIESIDSQKKAG